MQIYFLTRGNKRFTRNFIEACGDVYLDYKYKDKAAIIQFSPKEVCLWEASFPEDKLHDIMAMLGHQDYKGNKFLEKIKRYVVRILKLEPLPEEVKSEKKQIPRQFIGVHLIGVKKDVQGSIGEMI